MFLKTLTKLFLSLTTFSLTLSAYAFQYEGMGTITQSALDTPDSTRAGARAQARYYLREVDTSGKPKAEAAFLDYAGSVYTLADASTTTDGPETPNLYLAGFGTQFYFYMHCEALIPCENTHDESDKVFYLEAYSHVGRIMGDNDINSGLRFGVFALDNLLVALGYQQEPFGEDKSFNLNVKSVFKLSNHFVNVEFSGTSFDQADDQLSLDADWYIDNTWSIGLGLSDNQGNDESTLRTRKFFNDYFSTGLAFTNSDFANHTALEITLRY